MKKLDIYYEDKSILVVNKPSKLLTISTQKNNNSLYNEVYDYLHKKNQKCFIVHRLDKDTSGLIIFAKNEKSKLFLQDNWDKVKRKYVTVVQGEVKKGGIIESYLKETKTLFTYSSNDKVKGKYACTVYEPLVTNKTYSLLDILINTGRKNQIRVHLNDIGHPIIGDKKYGASKNPISRLGLHAYYLEFNHPVSKENMVIKTSFPKEFEKIFEKK